MKVGYGEGVRVVVQLGDFDLVQHVFDQASQRHIAPTGFILTDMTAAMPAAVLEQERQNFSVGELGKPEDIAAVAAFLASEGARFLTGQVISVNGGQHM